MPRKIDELFYSITARTGGFTRGLASSQKSMRGFVGRLSKTTAGLAAFGAAAVAAGIKATRMAASLDSALRDVATLLPGTVDNITRLREEVIALSTTVPETPELLSRGLYQVISAGVSDTAEAFEVLGVASRAAVAGLTDTFTSVDAITTVLNAYQLETSEAARVSDVFFTTIREGKLQFGDIAANIGTVATSAALAGVSIEEVGAALATLTKFGVNSAEAATSLNRLLLSLTQVTDEQAAAAERMGVEFNLAALQTNGLVGFLQDLQRATGGNIDQLAELNPNIRSARAAFVLAGEGAAEYGRILSETNDSAGSTGEAFVAINGSLENQARVLSNQVNAAWLSLGNNILPIVLAALENVNRLLESDIDTTVRLLRALGRESAAATLQAQEAERRLAEQIEDNTARIERSITNRQRAFFEFREGIAGGPTAGQTEGEFASLRTVADQFRLLPRLAGRARDEQQQLLEDAIDYADEIRRSVRLTEDQQFALAEIEGINANILGLIQQQNRLQEDAGEGSGREQELQRQVATLRERAAILSQAGEAEAENVEQIRETIALRQNELALIRAREDLAEAQSDAFARSLEEARDNAEFARRAAAATEGEERERFQRQADAFENTANALQRIEDLETARANIGKDITGGLEEQSDAVRQLNERLREARDLLAEPLTEEFFLESEVERAERAVELLRDGFEQLARFRAGLVELDVPGGGADFGQFDLDARLLAAQRAIEGVTRSGASLGQQALAVQGILDQWEITVDQLPPGFRAVVQAIVEARGEAEDVDRALTDIINDVSFAARGAVELANAFGLVGDEASAVVNQVALIGEGIGRIASGDILAGIGGVASGLAGIVGSIFGGGGPTPEQAARDESLRENSRRIRDLNERLAILGDVLRGLPGRLTEDLSDALGEAIPTLEGGLTGFGGAGIENQRRAEDVVGRIFASAGVSITDLEQAASALGLDADQLVRLLEGDPLNRAEFEEALQQAESLAGVLNRGLGEVLDSVQGRLDLLQDSFAILDIDDPADQIALLADELERAGTALSPQEIQRLAEGDEEFIEAIFRQLQQGTGRFTELGAFGELSFDEFLDILREIESLQDRTAEAIEADEGDFQNVSAINRLTVEQGDVLIGLAGSRNFYLEDIRDILQAGLSGFVVTDTMLAAASSVRHEFAGPLVIEVRGDVSTEAAAEIGREAGAAVNSSLGLNRDLGTELRRERAGLGLPPTRTQ